MTDLIQITQANIDGTPTNAVDARELHETLGVKKAFTTWIKTNLDSIGAEEHKDYMYLKNSLEGSGYKKVYIITADIAKHIAMMSKLQKGKEVRDYFIEAEKQSTQALMSPNQITEALALTAQSLTLIDTRLDFIHERTNKLEDYIEEDLKSRPVSFVQQRALQDVKNAKVYQLSPTDEKIQKKLHMKVWSVFKKNFHLPRYNELPAVKFDEAIWFLNNLEMNDML